MAGEVRQLKKEAVDLLLESYKKMDTVKAKKSVFEEALITMYALRLYQETAKMSPTDQQMIEAKVQELRSPHTQLLPIL